jgi:hypothetical protein
MTQILTAAVIQAQVNVIWRLECKVQTDNEGMIDLFQNVDLGNCEFYLLVHDQLFLLEHFQCVHLVVFGAQGQKDLPERAFSKLFGKLEMAQLQFVIIKFLIDHFVRRLVLRFLFFLFFPGLFFSIFFCFWNGGSRRLGFRLFHIGALSHL